MIGEHLEEFYGKKVVTYEDGQTFDFTKAAPRISIDWEEYEKEEKWEAKFERCLAQEGSENITHLVIGAAGGFEGEMTSDMALPTLIANKDKLPNLVALFIGDITYEESELSWIEAGDFSLLWENFPRLKALGIRGLIKTFGKISMPHLEQFTLECSGMSMQSAKDIIAADMPNLTRLELWLGTEDYQGETKPQDWAPLLNGNNFPKLTYLGLRNYDQADGLAKIVADAPILDRIETLDLSMGTLGDDGGAALYLSEKVRGLKHLNLDHHYMSDRMVSLYKGTYAPAPKPKKSGFFGFFKKEEPPQPAETKEDLFLSKTVAYDKLPIIPAGQFGPSLSLEQADHRDDPEYRYVAAGE